MNTSNVLTSSSNAAAPNLRPRARRLISGLDSDDEAGTVLEAGANNTGRRTSPFPLPYDQRPVSPIPSAHPQRSSPGQAKHRHGASATLGRNAVGRGKGSEASQTLAGLWGNSWTALQGIASDLLGSDVQDGSDRARVRRPLSMLDRQRSSSSMAWGRNHSTLQTGANAIGAGTKEEQVAAFRAQKRKDLLTRQDSSYADTLGKYKRRLSDERASASAPPADNEDREALVYVHHVAKEDTLAGITIRYNISANALRKANRMWPNDTVQTRQTLILPVDACAVKGKPTSGPGQEFDLLSTESESLSTLQAEEVPPPSAAPAAKGSLEQARNRANSASTHTTASLVLGANDAAPAWTHDSWVMLPGHKKPTEIVRLPRRALGYFPPARRKSVSYSDFETPSASLDLTRTVTGEGTTAAQAAGSELRSTPPRTSNGRRLNTATNGYFPAYLSGPGGVGTMSKNVNVPGPAPDSLNKMFAKHLPDVAPPKNQNVLYQPDLPLYSDDPTPLPSGHVTPAYPNSGPGNLGINLENMGGAIESWVRRIASKAQFPQERQQAARASVGTPGKGVGGIGDLIEMTQDFEIGEEDDLDVRAEAAAAERDRGRAGAGSVDVGGKHTTATSYFESSARVRGSAAAGAAIRPGKSGKAD